MAQSRIPKAQLDATLVDTSSTQTITGKTISGSSNTLSNIGNGSLTNSSITIGSTSVSLGGTASTIAGLTLTSPTLTTPALGTPSALVLTNATGTPNSIGLANGTGLPVSTGISGLGTGIATFLATPSSANLATAVTDETGSGALVFGTSPTLATAVLGSSTATTQTPSDNSTKLATTAYVDNAVLGQNFKEAVGIATTGNLVGVYLNGASGVGATFTYTATGVDTIDGVTLTLGMRVLLKNQTTTFQNGIYTVTTAGAIGVAGILTRAIDADQSNEWKTGDSVFVTAGTSQSTTTWAYTGIDSPTIGTTAITFVQTAGQGSFTAGNGISITGNSIAIDTSITVDKTTAQTLTNKTLTSPTLTAPILGTPASGIATNLTGTASGLTVGNVTTNANLTGPITSSGNATSIASQTGTGTKFVVDTSPTLITPTLGVATATSLNKLTITAPATSATLSLITGSTLATAGAFSTTLTATGATNVTLPTSGTLYGTASGSITSSQLITSISDETGTGNAVFSTSPLLTTPNILGGSGAPTTPSTGQGIIFGAGTGAVRPHWLNSSGTDETIFTNGGGPTTYTNPGNAGGTSTFFYMTMGTLKMFWGQTASTTGGTLPAPTVYTVTLPTSFFTTIQTCNLTLGPNNTANGQAVNITTLTTTTLSMTIASSSATTAEPVNVFIIGT